MKRECEIWWITNGERRKRRSRVKSQDIKANAIWNPIPNWKLSANNNENLVESIDCLHDDAVHPGTNSCCDSHSDSIDWTKLWLGSSLRRSQWRAGLDADRQELAASAANDRPDEGKLHDKAGHEGATAFPHPGASSHAQGEMPGRVCAQGHKDCKQ